MAASLSKIRDFAVKQRVMKEAKEVANWLLDNKEELALWGMDQKTVENITKHKPAFITVGIEPSWDNSQAEFLRLLDPSINTEGGFKDQIVKANMYRAFSLIQKDMAQRGFSREAPSGYPEIAGVMRAKGDPIAAAKYFRQHPAELITKADIARKLKVWSDKTPNSLRWANVTQILRGPLEARGDRGIYSLNVSGLGKPSTMGDYKESFAGVFKDAGMDPGPFKSQKTWMDYSWDRRKKNFKLAIEGGQPKVVYFGGKAGDMAKKFEDMAREMGAKEVKSESISGQSTGKNKLTHTETIRYATITHPGGNKTLLVSGPHSGAQGMHSNRGLAENIGKRMAELSQ